MRVLFITNLPVPYRIDFFNEWGKYCDLTVLFESPTAKDRKDEWMKNDFINFKGIFLKQRYIGKRRFCPEVVKYLSSKKFDFIVIGFYASLTGIFAIEYMRIRGIQFAISSDGGFIKDDSFYMLWLKKHLISQADLWLSTGKETSKYLSYYGADPERTEIYPFTSLMQSDILTMPVTRNEKISIRKKLNIECEKMVIGVGVIIYRKGWQILIRAAAGLCENTHVYIIGGAAKKDYEKYIADNNIQNVHFVDFKRKAELSDYYKASDVFVFPTREDMWGLVVTEAMAHGLPVVTTNMCNAGLELVSDDIGRIIDVNDHVQLSNAINEILDMGEDAYNKMCKKTLEQISAYSIENMARVHNEILLKYFKRKGSKDGRRNIN